ncbi:MAG: TIGR02452 family protein [Oscillospiraceae bacterium]|nr:TIGR02452 family protein [Oscillospiraceae bacterium]MBR3535518.1 TIGR02452 family protein [Oscillospiraceae bacterium]
MGRKDDLKDKALKHTEKMVKLYSDEIQKSILATHVFGNEFVRDKITGKRAEFVLEKSYTQESVLKHSNGNKLAVLNFASYRHPGGGFLNGAMAQEEALCHASFLYNVLSTFPDYYEWNEANYNRGLYMNRALYSPGVYFFNDDENKHVTADVITCAAPNRSVMLKKGILSEEQNERALKDRIRFIRDICDSQGVEVLIAGAFGCGVFAQRPERVASLFIELFSDTMVKQVVFAVPPDRNYAAFERVLYSRKD